MSRNQQSVHTIVADALLLLQFPIAPTNGTENAVEKPWQQITAPSRTVLRKRPMLLLHYLIDQYFGGCMTHRNLLLCARWFITRVMGVNECKNAFICTCVKRRLRGEKWKTKIGILACR